MSGATRSGVQSNEGPTGVVIRARCSTCGAALYVHRDQAPSSGVCECSLAASGTDRTPVFTHIMNASELAETIPGFVREYVGCAEGLRPLRTDRCYGAWSYSRGRALIVLCVYNGGIPTVRVRAGVAADIPYSSAVCEYVNYKNARGGMMFGRMFLVGALPFLDAADETGPCSVIIQEAWLGDWFSMEFVPTVQVVIDSLESIGMEASVAAEEFLKRFGGRLYRSEEGTVLVTQ